MSIMKFHLENFAKIASADLELKGLTVIVGKNNSGKSTVGKALYALCSVFHNLEERVTQSIIHSIKQVAQNTMGFMPSPILETIAEKLAHGTETSFKDILRTLEGNERTFMQVVSSEDEQLFKIIQDSFNRLVEKVKKIKSIPAKQYREAIVWEYFDKVFHKQLLPLFENVGETRTWCECDKRMEVVFHSTTAEIQKDGPLQCNIWYLNGPRVLNLINSQFPLDSLDEYEKELVDSLRISLNTSSPTGMVDAQKVVNREKLHELEKCFSQVMANTQAGFVSHECAVPQEGCTGPVLYENLSSGLKSFVVLRHMLIEGVLSVGDCLVLDEPEVNLHPEWQIIYAELVVLLCKTFGLKILLTSHSVDFIHALSLYAKLYKQESKLALYKSESLASGAVAIKRVDNDNWEYLFEEFVNAIDILEKLRDRIRRE